MRTGTRLFMSWALHNQALQIKRFSAGSVLHHARICGPAAPEAEGAVVDPSTQ